MNTFVLNNIRLFTSRNVIPIPEVPLLINIPTLQLKFKNGKTFQTKDIFLNILIDVRFPVIPEMELAHCILSHF